MACWRLGSTGEFPALTLEERKEILADIVAAAGTLPVLANISDIRPEAAIELGRHARSLGLGAVALMPPNFFPLSAADQRDFFLRVADRVQLPLLLYNFPEVLGNRVPLETIAAVADRVPVIGLKQSGSEFSYHQPLIALAKKKGFAIFSGADTRLPEVFGLGAAGCIGGLVNFVPEPMVAIFHACGAGARGDCREAAARMVEASEPAWTGSPSRSMSPPAWRRAGWIRASPRRWFRRNPRAFTAVSWPISGAIFAAGSLRRMSGLAPESSRL